MPPNPFLSPPPKLTQKFKNVLIRFGSSPKITDGQMTHQAKHQIPSTQSLGGLRLKQTLDLARQLIPPEAELFNACTPEISFGPYSVHRRSPRDHSNPRARADMAAANHVVASCATDNSGSTNAAGRDNLRFSKFHNGNNVYRAPKCKPSRPSIFFSLAD